MPYIQGRIRCKVDLLSEAEAENDGWFCRREQNLRSLKREGHYAGTPTDAAQQLRSIQHWGQHEQRLVLVDVHHLIQKGQVVFLWLGAVERLRLLDQCPCVSINGDALQFPSFDAVRKCCAIFADRELIASLGFVIFPQHELPDELSSLAMSGRISRNAGVVFRGTRNQKKSRPGLMGAALAV